MAFDFGSALFQLMGIFLGLIVPILIIGSVIWLLISVNKMSKDLNKIEEKLDRLLRKEEH